MFERQQSSVGCSTSYTIAQRPLTTLRVLRRGRGTRGRCAAQQRPYRGTHSPEREAPRRPGQHHRPLGPVAASAATAPPPTPRPGTPPPVDADLNTSIPDAIPSLEHLEDLRSRAMQASRGKAGRAAHDTPRGVAQGNVLRPFPAKGGGGAFAGHLRVHDDLDQMPAPAMEPPLPHAEIEGALLANAAPPVSNPPLHGRSALSRAVPPPQPLARPQPTRTCAPEGQPRKPLLGPRRPGTPSPRRAPHGPQNLAVKHTLAIKSERDWRRLPGLLAELTSSGGLDAFTASMFLTHIAQLVAKAQPVSQTDVAMIERMQASVLESVERWMPEYRARQISNMTWALARLGLPSGAVFVREHLLPASYPLLAWYEPQHLSNTMWALATTGVAPDDTWLEEYLTAAFVALQRRSLAPQHLANVLWALERLGVIPDQEWMEAYYNCVQAAAPTCNAQDCSNILSSLALMRMHERQSDTTAELADRLAQRLRTLLAPAVDRSTPSALSGPATPVDAAVLTPTPGHGAIAGLPEAAAAAMDVSDQAIANSLWALAVMGVQPSGGLWEAAMAALRQRLVDPTRQAPGVHPVALTIVVWASTTLGRPLPAGVTSLVFGRVRAAQMEAMEPRSLATLVWALANAPPEQARPPAAWVADAVAASGRSVTQLGAQAVSNLLYGLCQLDARPPPAWMSGLINHFHRNLGSEASGQSLSNVLWCLAKMGYRLNEEGMDILFSLVHNQLAAWQQRQQQQQVQPSQDQPQLRGGRKQEQAEANAVPPPFNSQEVSNVIYAIASMGYHVDPEGAFAQLLLEAARARLREANAQELSNLMWCLATLSIRPSQPWLDDCFTVATAQLPTFKPFDLAQALYATAKLHLTLHRPAVHNHDATAGEVNPATPLVSAAASRWLAAAVDAAPQLIASANAQDLCNLSWALVQLRVPVAADSPLADAFTARLVALAAVCDASQLALGVWALGKWRVRPSRVQLERLELTTFRKVPSMRPHELAALLSGFAGMGHVVPAEWLSDAMQQVAARSKEFGPQEWTMVVYALTRVQSDSSLTEMVLRLLPRLDRMPLPSLVLTAYSGGCMGPSPVARQLVSRCLALLAAGSAGTAATGAGGRGRAAAHGTQAARRGTTKGFAASAGNSSKPAAARQTMAAAAATVAVVQPHHAASEHGSDGAGGELATGADHPVTGADRPVAVASLTAVELSALLWSAVRVGIKVLPRDFCEQFYSCTEAQLQTLPASLVASYLWAAGRLRMWLPSRWRAALMQRAFTTLPAMRTRELAMCMAGLLWLRMWPTESFLRKLTTCYQAHRAQMPERVRKHADVALLVLTRRLAQTRERGYGANVALRLRWRRQVLQGNMEAVAAGTTGYRGALATAPRPAGHVSRRGALRLGVLRTVKPGAAAATTTAHDRPARDK